MPPEATHDGLTVMGLNMLGDKKIRFLRELTGLATIDRAVTASHVESGRWWEFRVLDAGGHWHGWYDRTDDSWGRIDEDDDFRHWSSCEDLAKGDAQ